MENEISKAERIRAAAARYEAAAHAMQSGVAIMMQRDPKSTEPKHLRTGVNSALVDSGALAKLLIRKGIIDEAEYFEALADLMEAEKNKYEEKLQQPGGAKITLA